MKTDNLDIKEYDNQSNPPLFGRYRIIIIQKISNGFLLMDYHFLSSVLNMSSMIKYEHIKRE